MKLTVLIPIYNTRPDHLMEAVYSILHQHDSTVHDIILIDDCSDNKATIACIKTLCEHYPQIKAEWMDKNSGTSAALNRGHEMASTGYVAIMGSDDVSDLSRFRKQIAFIKENPEVDVIGTNLFGFYTDDIFRKRIFVTRHLQQPDTSKGWFMNHGTAIYKLKSVIDAGGYNILYNRGQDVELWNRMLGLGYNFGNVEEVLMGWRRYR